MFALQAGQSGEDLRELTVEGTTFDPTRGGVHGLTSLDRNLEVRHRACPRNSYTCVLLKDLSAHSDSLYWLCPLGLQSGLSCL